MNIYPKILAVPLLAVFGILGFYSAPVYASKIIGTLAPSAATSSPHSKTGGIIRGDTGGKSTVADPLSKEAPTLLALTSASAAAQTSPSLSAVLSGAFAGLGFVAWLSIIIAAILFIAFVVYRYSEAKRKRREQGF